MKLVKGALMVSLVALLCTACDERIAWKGTLAALADSVFGARPQLHCLSSRREDCWANTGDTVSYFRRSPSGVVQLVGREWDNEANRVLLEFREREVELQREYGDGRRCTYEDPSYQIADRRWQVDGASIALVAIGPAVGLRANPSLTFVWTLEPVSCGKFYPVPRRH